MTKEEIRNLHRLVDWLLYKRTSGYPAARCPRRTEEVWGDQLKKFLDLWKEEFSEDASENEPKDGEIVYACGWEADNGSYGMFDGPNPSLKAMLEVVPESRPDDKTVLLRFNLDGTSNVLYRWDYTKCKWRKEEE